MKRVIYSVFTALFTLSLCTSCSKQQKQMQTSEPIVQTTEVKSVQDSRRKEYSFTTRPFRTSELSFRVGGPIKSSTNYIGNYYRKGEVIATIDQRDFEIRKNRAEAVYNQAKAEFARIESLFHKGNLSPSSFDKAQAEYISAKMAWESACNDLNDTRLIAPSNGYVSDVYIEQFQDVKPTQPVVSFIDIDQLKIEAFVPQDIASNLPLSSKVHLKFDAHRDTVYEVNISEISKNTTRNNLSYLLTALLPNSDKKLLAGMSGKLSFDVPATTTPTSVVIPQSAVSHRPTVGDFVWVVDPDSGIAGRREVSISELLPNGNVSVLAGLSEGEIVAVSGLRFLSDGMKVNEKRN